MCDGDVSRVTLEPEREEKIRDRTPHIAEDDEINGLECGNCGHVVYRIE